MQALRIALAQICPRAGHAEENQKKITVYLNKAAEQKADLVLFPECSLTGYDSRNVCPLPCSHEQIQQLFRESDRLKTALCFGFAEQNENRLYLTQVLHTGEETIFYRKTHLGTKEKAVFSAGDSFPVSHTPVRCGMQLCWESHIPEISSLQRAQDVQLLLIPYASPMSGKKTMENWAVHLPARASDNGVFAAACNLLFKTPEGMRGGGLAVYDPKGRLTASYEGTDEHMIFCDLTGPLPREYPDDDMHHISYFDRKRPELF